MADQKVEILHCPLFEDLARDDMLRHFKDLHGYDPTSYHGRSKANMETLKGIHRREHEDWPRIMADARRQTIDHDHVALTADELGKDNEFAKHANFAESLDKPLTVSQKNSLKALVDNDFAALRKEMEEFSAEVLQGRLKSVKVTYDAKRGELDTFKDDLRSLSKKAEKDKAKVDARYEEALTALGQRAEAAGIKYVPRQYIDQTFEVKGEKEAEAAAKSETMREKQAALVALERKRLGAQRQIMLAGIPKESLELLQKVPTAKALMAEAAAEREVTKQNAQKMLAAEAADKGKTDDVEYDDDFEYGGPMA